MSTLTQIAKIPATNFVTFKVKGIKDNYLNIEKGGSTVKIVQYCVFSCNRHLRWWGWWKGQIMKMISCNQVLVQPWCNQVVLQSNCNQVQLQSSPGVTITFLQQKHHFSLWLAPCQTPSHLHHHHHCYIMHTVVLNCQFQPHKGA